MREIKLGLMRRILRYAYYVAIAPVQCFGLAQSIRYFRYRYTLINSESRKKLSRVWRIHFKRWTFLIDCAFADQLMPQEGYASFGNVNEIYILNSYFRHLKIDFDKIRNVVDLGGNRGAFSLLAATFASKVVYVEAVAGLREILVHNMAINNFGNYVIENVFVGEGGLAASLPEYSNVPRKRLSQIMTDNALDSIDFLKVDIEGSEFALFESTEFLDRIGYIAMEIHPQYGDVRNIIRMLETAGFSVVLDMRSYYLWATNQRWERSGK